MFKSVAVAALLALALPFSVLAGADDPAPQRSPRVRPHDGRSAAILLEGIDRSETVRLLVDRLESLKVIVYVEMQPAIRNLAGRMVWLTATEHFRYLRISLNPELGTEMLISSLGHELQHALEVALTPSVVDEPSLEDYYRKHGINMRSHISGWDTQAARDTGDLVRREIANRPARAMVRTSQGFDPMSWHVAYGRARDRFASR